MTMKMTFYQIWVPRIDAGMILLNGVKLGKDKEPTLVSFAVVVHIMLSFVFVT